MTEEKRTLGQRIADDVAEFGGSWKFIFSGLGIIAIWVLINTLPLFDFMAYDQYPFIFLNLFLSLIAAFQAPFILMSQYRAEKKQDLAYRTLFQEIKDLVEQDIAHTRMIETHEKRSGKRLVHLFKLLAEKKITPETKIDLDNI